MKPTGTPLRRRTFVTAAVCAPAIAVAALAARRAPPEAVPAAAAPRPAEPAAPTAAPSGYRETEHIRQYYASAAF